MLEVAEAPPNVRRCSRCGLIKPIAEFNRSSEFGYQFFCRDCQKAWYWEHREQHIANVDANTGQYRERNRQLVLDYLRTHPCVDCGESDPAVLEFDHLNEKVRCVSQLKWSGANPQRLMAEIAKCEVRCVNCHMKRTAEQRGWRKNKGRPA